MERETIWWTRGKKLGRGSFGVVSLAEAYDEDQMSSITPPFVMAVKSAQLSLSHSLRKERKLLDQLEGCPYVLRCFGDEISIENGVLLYNIMLEYASGGSLADRIKSFSKGLPEFKVRRYTKNVLMGLSYIHKQGYVHCDIKPHNILLVGEDSTSLSSSCLASSLIIPRLKRVEETAKIADFGLAMKITKKKSDKLRGTAMYLAPESVRHQEYQPYSDIWALGCTVLELITGTTPWHCEPHTEPCALLYRIGWGKKLPEIPSWVSAEAKDFLEKCLVDDPKLRWSADMLLGHPFVSSMDCTKDVKEERSKVFRSEARHAAYDSSSQSSSIDLLIKPYKIMWKRGINRQQHEERPLCKKRKRTMQEVQEAQQQPNTTCYQRYWGVKRIAAVYGSRDDDNFSLELLW